MGLLSDFFIATRAEVDSLGADEGPASSFPTVRARSIEVVKLTRLQCIIDGSLLDDHLGQLGSMLVRSDGDDGPWVFLVPDVIAGTLAQSDGTELQQIANAWALIDEWKMDGGTPEEIVRLLTDLGSLAKRAIIEHREMYLWVSL